jgi:putative transposase
VSGKPAALRLDNGAAFTGSAFEDWCRQRDTELRFIEPGKPDQHAFSERFNRTYRHARRL